MYLIIPVCLLLSLSGCTSSASVVDPTPAINASTTAAPKTIKEIEKEIEGLLNYITKMLLPYFVRNSDLKISSQCQSTLIKLFVDLRKLKLPAIKLLDAMLKPPYGLLRGSFSFMGDYDECLEISATKRGDVATSKAQEYYHGQYCTVEVDFPPKLLSGMVDYAHGRANITDFGKFGPFIEEFPGVNFAGGYFKFNLGVCLPSTCTTADLEEILKLVPLSFLPMGVKGCEDGTTKPITTDQFIFLAIFGIVAVLVLTGTVLDGLLYLKSSNYDGNHKGRYIQFLLAFSIYNNTKKFLATDKNVSSEIACVNGMYVLGTFLVVIYHTYFLPFFLLFSRTASSLGHYMKDPQFTLIVTMGISIEAYFLFSGLFLVYARFRRNPKEVRVNIIKIIVRRYIRLCPSLLIILGIIIVLPIFVSGPVWAEIFDKAADNSRKWWWTYALMFNNFLPIKEQNFLYLWFIPCLMQISIVGALLVWILAKYRKLGICAIILVGIACNATLGVMTALRSYPPSYAIYYFHDREKFEEFIYTSPLSHVFSYGIGMLLGYYMSTNPILKWSRAKVACGWVISFILTVGTQYILYAGHEGTDPDPILSGVYASVHRTLFSIGLSWIILACSHGYGGVVGNILQWKGFGPLSKLGYFAYLIHYVVIAFHVSVSRIPITFSHYEVWMRIFSYTSITLLVSFVLYITFELPLNFLESLLYPPRRLEPAMPLPTLTPAHLSKTNDVIVISYNGNTIKPIINGSNAEHSRL